MIPKKLRLAVIGLGYLVYRGRIFKKRKVIGYDTKLE